MKYRIPNPIPRSSSGSSCPVQVHTSLPPGICAPVTAYLILKISSFRCVPIHVSTDRRSNSRNLPDGLSVYVRWWGEPATNPCAVFTPRLSHKAGHKQLTSTTARYKITVPQERFKAYLKDMNVLYMNVVDSACARFIGRARLDHIGRLSLENPIHTVLTVTDEVGEKLGELTVSISIEDVVDVSVRQPNARMSEDVRSIPAESPQLPQRRLDEPADGESAHYLPDPTQSRPQDEPPDKQPPTSSNPKEHAIDEDDDGSNPDISPQPGSSPLVRQSPTDTDHQTLKSNALSHHFNRNLISKPIKSRQPPESELVLKCRHMSNGTLRSSDMLIPQFTGMSSANRFPSNPELHLGSLSLHDQNPHCDGPLANTRRLLSLIHSQPVDSNVASVNQLLFPSPHDDPIDENCNVEDSPIQHFSQNEHLVEELFFPSEDLKTSSKFFTAYNCLQSRSLGENVVPALRDARNDMRVSRPSATDQTAFCGVNLLVRNLQLTQPSTERNRLLHPHVVSLNYPSKSSPTEASPRDRGNRQSRCEPPRSRSKSPVVQQSLNLGAMSTVNLEASIQIHGAKLLQRTCITSSVSLHRATKPLFYGLTGRDQQNMVAFAPKNSKPELLISLEIPRTGNSNSEKVRFRVFTAPDVSPGSVLADFTPTLICQNDLALDNIQNALFSVMNRNTKETVCMSLNLFPPGTGPSKESGGSSNSSVWGRLDLELEPVLPTTGVVNEGETKEPTQPLDAHLEKLDKHSAPLALKRPSESTINTNLPSGNTNSFQPIHLETFLSISQSRGLYIANDKSCSGTAKTGIRHSHLTLRLPWCQDRSSAVKTCNKVGCFSSAPCSFEDEAPVYDFHLRTSYTLNETLLNHLLKSFAVIEVWVKLESDPVDRLAGLTKIPTKKIVTLFSFVDSRSGNVLPKQQPVLQSLLSFQNPTILVDSWLPITDPYSGSQRGELHVRLAVGTTQQIDRLVGKNTDTMLPHDNVKRPDSTGVQMMSVGTGHTGVVYVEHSLTVTIEALREFDPHIALGENFEFAGAVPWGDCDCFVQYNFPSGGQSGTVSTYRTPVQLLVAPGCETLVGDVPVRHHLVSCNFSAGSNKRKASHWSQTHQVTLRSKQQPGTELNKSIVHAQPNAFLNWLHGNLSHNSTGEGLTLELWLRVYSPNLLDRLVARGNVSSEVLANLIGHDPETVMNNERQTRCWVQLFNIHSAQPNGRLGIFLMYGSRLADYPPLDLVDDTEQNTTVCARQEQLPINPLRLIPNIAQPGVQLRVQLHRFTGLKSLFSNTGPFAFCGHVRLHCMLIYPRSSSSGRCNLPGKCVVLGTASSRQIRGSFCEDDLNTALEMVLPVSWRVLAVGMKTEIMHEISLIELLLNGTSSQQQQFTNWTSSRWCLLLQVDVWQSDASSPVQTDAASSDYRMGWNLSDFGDKYRSVWPGPGHKLVSSTRLPLAGLILTKKAKIPAQWYPQCGFASNPGDRSSSFGGGYFVGGVQVSAELPGGTETKLQLLEYFNQSEQADAQENRCFQDWSQSFSLNRETSINLKHQLKLCDRWHDGIDDRGCHYKQFILNLDAIRLPSEFLLLQDSSQQDAEQIRFWFSTPERRRPFAFIRFSFYRSGVQTSRLVPLPVSCQEPASVVLQLNETKDYTFPVSEELYDYLVETDLELQVWVIWTNSDRDGESITMEQLNIEFNKQDSLVAKPFDPPSPRHVGSAHIPLSKLLHPPVPASLAEPDSDGCNPTVIVGDPSGLAWFCSGRINEQPLPVFPLYRAGAEDLHESWVSVRLEMHGARTQFCANIPTCQPTPLLSSAGALGWNLGKFMKRRTLPNLLQSHVEDTNKPDDSYTETTFPAEVTVERAFHLKPKALMERAVKPPPDVEHVPKSGIVFVTFPVDGDQPGNFASHNGLWNRLCHSQTCSPSRLIAATARVPFDSCVSWNYRRFVVLPTWLLKIQTRRKLVFHVWFQKENGDGTNTVSTENDWATAPSNVPELIGIASVDLTCLSGLIPTTTPRGLYREPGSNNRLDTVYGWYHVMDDTGTERGQILLGVKPLLPKLESDHNCPDTQHTESLNLLKEQTHNNLDAPLVDSTTVHLPLLSNMRNTLSQWPLDNPLCSPSSGLQLAAESNATLQNTVVAENESTQSNLFEQLHKQLNELDAINAKFKQRLARGDPDGLSVQSTKQRNSSTPQTKSDVDSTSAETSGRNTVEPKWEKGCGASASQELLPHEQALSLPHDLNCLADTMPWGNLQQSNSIAVDFLSHGVRSLKANSSEITKVTMSTKDVPFETNPNSNSNLNLDVRCSSDSHENLSVVPTNRTGGEGHHFEDIQEVVSPENPGNQVPVDSNHNSIEVERVALNESFVASIHSVENEVSDPESVDVSPLPAWDTTEESIKQHPAKPETEDLKDSEVVIQRQNVNRIKECGDEDHSWPSSHSSSREVIPSENPRHTPYTNEYSDEVPVTCQRSSSRMSENPEDCSPVPKLSSNADNAHQLISSTSSLLPTFFPPSSVISQVVSGIPAHIEVPQNVQNARMTRLSELRSGLRDDLGVQKSRDEQFESIRRRIDSRISDAVRMINDAIGYKTITKGVVSGPDNEQSN
ncbi:C2 domain-containing protein 3 [Clonorchis sinensis]|uniref:C2 domain-containing protein 3 n=1 Tax=Clonorchis sinensis TaxID=79923 RepID=A0A8T1MGF2_CLOSI|nr:C2 domain-containing protein 3 [Clonorchis sinensis]